MLPPSPPTDPDVQNYCIRFFAGELRGQTEDERAPNYRAPRHHAWPSLAESPVRLSIVVTWTRLWAQSPRVFPGNGSLSRRLPSLVRVPASPVPRSQRYYEGATTSHPRTSGHLFVSLPPPAQPLLRSCPAAALLEDWRPLPGRGFLFAGCPAPALSRGREWDLSGLQAIRPVPLLRSKTPVESRCPRQSRPPQCCLRYPYGEGLSGTLISGLTRSFSTRYRTLHAWRCRTRARLASGWRAAPLPGGIQTLWTATKGFSSV